MLLRTFTRMGISLTGPSVAGGGDVAFVNAAAIDPAHVVQFYEDDAFLLESMTRFVGAGLGAGDAAIVIATPRHRNGLEKRLGARGVDLRIARRQGRYIALDAAETLSALMADGCPDEIRFRAVVGETIERAARGGRGVRAFGEMVALLWDAGRRDAALRLEGLWNELAERAQFSLLCAYPMHGFNREADGESFLQVCGTHGDIVPAESYTRLTDGRERLMAIGHLQQKARALEAEVAQRKRAEEALRARNATLRALIQASPVPIAVIEPDTTVRLWNPAAERVFGWSAAEVLGRPIPIVPEDQRAECRRVHEVLLTGESFSGVETHRLRRDGSRVDVLIAAAPLGSANGPPREMVLLFEDITERKRAEVEREGLLRTAERARADAEAASRAKDEFLSVVSHELRTPLAAMLGWVSVLKTGATGDRATRALDTIERSGRAQAKLIEDLLDVSRIVTGGMRLDLRLVDLPAVIREAVDTIRPTADVKGVRLEARLDPTAGPVAGDADRLQQIAWNLLSNAVKFTPAGGLVEVCLERRDDDVRLAVRDTGRGISAEFLPFVFERFRQADSAVSRRTGGLGLGLAIVRHLVELHGGAVAVASNGEGRGAEFAITLPLTPFKVDAARSGRAPRLLDGLGILVVDDDVDTQESLRILLEALGARVTTAGSVREAREALRRLTPDAVVSDIGLPDEDGYALVRELRATDRLRPIPAIAVTGRDAGQDAGRAVAAGYQVRLDKPVDLELLVAAISQLTVAPQGASAAPGR
jgi:PAS domain S-box-containing protein